MNQPPPLEKPDIVNVRATIAIGATALVLGPRANWGFFVSVMLRLLGTDLDLKEGHST